MKIIITIPDDEVNDYLQEDEDIIVDDFINCPQPWLANCEIEVVR